MRIGIAQINPTVGDLGGNFEKIFAAYERLAAADAELVLCLNWQLQAIRRRISSSSRVSSRKISRCSSACTAP